MLEKDKVFGIYKILGQSKVRSKNGLKKYWVECIKCGKQVYKSEEEVLNSKRCQHGSRNCLSVFTDSQLQQLLDTSTSFRDVLLKLNLCISDDNYDFLQAEITKRNLNTEILCQNKKENLKKVYKEYSKEEIFCENSVIKAGIKKYLIKFGLKSFEKCEYCGLTEWQGQKIPLQVHHINGNRTNNSLYNLAVICPNCHALTDTYGGKNLSVLRNPFSEELHLNKTYCKKCGCIISQDASLCLKCYKEKRIRNSKCPSKEELEKHLNNFESYSSIARFYGVSDNTIKNWVKKLGLTKPKKPPKKHKPKKNYQIYRIDNIEKTATGWEKYLELPQHKIKRYAENHTKEEIITFIESFYILKFSEYKKEIL